MEGDDELAEVVAVGEGDDTATAEVEVEEERPESPGTLFFNALPLRVMAESCALNEALRVGLLSGLHKGHGASSSRHSLTLLFSLAIIFVGTGHLNCCELKLCHSSSSINSFTVTYNSDSKVSIYEAKLAPPSSLAICSSTCAVRVEGKIRACVQLIFCHSKLIRI